MSHEFIKKIVNEPRINSYKFIEENNAEKYVLYGIGNLAEAVNKQFKDRGITFDIALVDEGYDIKKTFLGMPVQRFGDFSSKEENRKKYNLVIGYAAGYRRKEALINEGFFKNIYCIARPFEHHKAFDKKFVDDHEIELEMLYEALEDNESKETLCAFINSRITEDEKYVVNVSPNDIDEFYNDVYKPEPNETFLDIGAYQGGSINRFLEIASVGSINRVIGVEPENSNYNKLCKNLNYLEEKKKRLVKIGCYDKKTKLSFNSSDDQCCRLDDNSNTFIDVDTVDNICLEEQNISTIYIGISVAVLEIIKGARTTIAKNRPKIIIILGTMKEEIYQIPLYLKKIEPSYKIYLRFQSSMPSRMLLYAIPIK